MKDQSLTSEAVRAVFGHRSTVTFPAIRGKMGRNEGEVEYFITLMNYPQASKLIVGVDGYALAESAKEAREVREAAPSAPERFNRIPTPRRFKDILEYITSNDDFRFSALTLAYGGPSLEDQGDSSIEFRSLRDLLDIEGDLGEGAEDIGALKMDVNEQLVVVDGQHRLGAIKKLVSSGDHVVDVANQTIPVVIFPYLHIHHAQQIFSDLNRHAKKTSRSLDITYDHRDELNLLMRRLTGGIDGNALVPKFIDRIDFENPSVPAKSKELMTISTMYSASLPVIGAYAERSGVDTGGPRRFTSAISKTMKDDGHKEKVEALLIQVWGGLFEALPDWETAAGTADWPEKRKLVLHHISGVVNGMGAFIGAMIREKGQDKGLKEALKIISRIDWDRRDPDGLAARRWQGIALNGEQVIAPSNLRPNVLALLKWKAGIEAGTEVEERLYGHFEKTEKEGLKFERAT